ncbi:glycoside hydrolase family 35 protein [Streptomyces sp. NPDC002520]
MTLTIKADGFRRDGRPHRIVSGAMHYFRVHPEQWRDRLLRLRAMGLNTLETYVAWNFHERTPGEFDFEGWRDIAGFVRLAGETGLDVIVRPGPYICAEWEFGGLPARLLADPSVRLRCGSPAYLAAVDQWFGALLPQLVPLQATSGGPIVAWQVENEYGSFGDDAAYLRHLFEGLRARGAVGPFVTSDGPADSTLSAGMVDGVHATVNFGSRTDEAFAALRRFQPGGPAMCMEFWNGWFDHWGEPHHVRSAESAAAELDAILRTGASVNFYMAHGGTNFGLWNGANCQDSEYQPTVTSYDYDAPIGESGELTEKFHRYREVIARYLPVPDTPLPMAPARLAPQSVPTRAVGALLDGPAPLRDPIESPTPLSMEELGQSTGLVHYRARVSVPPGDTTLEIRELHDRAQVFIDGAPAGVLERNAPQKSLAIRGNGAEVTLDVLVENQGRVNFGPDLADRKGILGGVLIGQRYVFGWQHRPIPLDTPPASTGQNSLGPSLHRATITIDEPADGFLALEGWTKGFCWINGFLLGRYWRVGPQRTLYAPAPLWQVGPNEITILELDKPGQVVELRASSDLGSPAHQPGSTVQ